MDTSSFNDLVTIACSVNAVSLFVLAEYAGTIHAQQAAAPCKRKHSCWVRGHLLQRNKFGAYNRLMRDLEEFDPVALTNFIRTDASCFTELLRLVTPFITKKDIFQEGNSCLGEAGCYATISRYWRIVQKYSTSVSSWANNNCQLHPRSLQSYL